MIKPSLSSDSASTIAVPVGSPDAAPGKAGKQMETQVLPTNNLPLVFSALVLTVFLAAMDQTIVSTALPTIVKEIGTSTTSASAYSWVGTAYLLMATCLSPLCTSFSASLSL